MECDCKSVFNRLSRTGRVKLRGAAVTKALTGFIRDDTQANPVRYPFYAAYIFILATPLPVPFMGTVVLAATLIWARYSKSGYAARLNGYLQEAFNNQARLICDHKEFLVPDSENSGTHKVRTLALAWDTTKASARHTWQATKHAWNAAKNFILK